MMKKILVGLDGSAGSFKAFAEALDLAKAYSATLETITVEEIPRFSETIGEIVEEKQAEEGKFGNEIRRAKELAKKQGISVRSHVIVGHEVKTIGEFIKKHGFDLLAIGFMGHSALYDRMMGSTCQSLVRLASCTVLVVK